MFSDITRMKRCKPQITIAVLLMMSRAVLLMVLGAGGPVHGSRILLAPFPWKSHVVEMLTIGGGLSEKGHDVYIILPHVYPDIHAISQTNITVINYLRKDSDFLDRKTNYYDDYFDEVTSMTLMTRYRHDQPDFQAVCTNVLTDQVLFRQLQHLRLDLAIVGTVPRSRCYLILMYRLDIPYISMNIMFEPWLFRNPSLPSFAPFIYGTAYSDQMTLWERILNTWNLLDWTIGPRMAVLDDSLVTKYAPDKPAVSLNHLTSRSLLYFVGTDFVIDYPRPLMPNEIHIGGLAAKPAAGLPADLHSFLSRCNNGAVVISLGSSDLLPQYIYTTINATLNKINDTCFIWRYKFTFPVFVPAYVKLMKWIPQNDLLGHPKVNLFITHGGANSQFEAVYHGVPMITIPIHTDQPYNAIRAERKGVATTINVKQLTSETLAFNIRKMLTTTSYQENIDKLSGIFRSRPMSPRARAVYWVEHVVQFGGGHLHSSALDMPWYQYLMLDIALILMITSITICYILYKVIKIIYNQSVVLKKIKLH